MTNAKDIKIKKLQEMMVKCDILLQDSGDLLEAGFVTQEDDTHICHKLMLIQKRLDRILVPLLKEEV